MRQLIWLPPWCSASNMLVGLGVRGFHETRRVLSYSLFERINVSANIVIMNLKNSDAAVHSHIRKMWNHLLYVNM